MTLSITHDNQAHEIVIHCPQGIITVNECLDGSMTRIVLMTMQDAYVTRVEDMKSPVILCVWNGAAITEPDRDDEITEEFIPLFEEVEG